MRNGSYKRGEEIFAPLPLFLGTILRYVSRKRLPLRGAAEQM